MVRTLETSYDDEVGCRIREEIMNGEPRRKEKAKEDL